MVSSTFESVEAQQRMLGIFGKPAVEHRPFRHPAGEVRRHRIGMGEEPAVAPGLPRRLRLRRLAQRGQELLPGKLVIGAVGEVDVGEGGNAEGLFTVGLQQRDDAEFAVCRVEGLNHEVLELAPSAFDVVGRQDEKRLAAFHDAPLHLVNAGRAAREVAEIDERLDPSLLDARQQLAAHPRFVWARVGEKDVHSGFSWKSGVGVVHGVRSPGSRNRISGCIISRIETWTFNLHGLLSSRS